MSKDTFLDFLNSLDDFSSDEEIDIKLDDSAIKSINEIYIFVLRHKNIRYFIYTHRCFPDKRLASTFARKIATYISYKNNRKIITEYEVATAMKDLIFESIRSELQEFVFDDPIDRMLSGYPLSILIDVCYGDDLKHRAYMNIDLIVENVRRLIFYRENMPITLPDKIISATVNRISLVGEASSPLNSDELKALQNFLECKKSSYINLTLYCIYELKKHDKYLYNDEPPTIGEIKEIFDSTWFYLINMI